MFYADVDKVRDSNGVLPSVTTIGGYPVYYVADDAAAICPTCANEEGQFANEDSQMWNLVQPDVNWENPALYCEHCSNRIPSAYVEEG